MLIRFMMSQRWSKDKYARGYKKAGVLQVHGSLSATLVRTTWRLPILQEKTLKDCAETSVMDCKCLKWMLSCGETRWNYVRYPISKPRIYCGCSIRQDFQAETYSLEIHVSAKDITAQTLDSDAAAQLYWFLSFFATLHQPQQLMINVIVTDHMSHTFYPINMKINHATATKTRRLVDWRMLYQYILLDI